MLQWHICVILSCIALSSRQSVATRELKTIKRYLTLTLAPSGVDRWFVRYDINAMLNHSSVVKMLLVSFLCFCNMLF